jgi:hypothetical protein
MVVPLFVFYFWRKPMDSILKESTAPPYRYQLKSKMILSGYRTNCALAKQINNDPARISRILNGWEYPSPRMIQQLSQALGISVKDLVQLL